MKIFIPDYQTTVPRGPQLGWRDKDGQDCRGTAIYLHGKLYHQARADIVYNQPVEGKPCAVTFYMPDEAGEEQVRVKMDAGEFDAIFVWWWVAHYPSPPRLKGLVVAPDDVEALAYARKKQAEKSPSA